MKKLFTLTLMGSSLLFSGQPAKADWDNWGVKQSSSGDTTTMSIYKIDTSNNNSASLFGSKTFTNIGPGVGEGSVSFNRFDKATGMLIFKRTNPSEEHSFSLSNGNWVNEGTPWTDSYNNTGERPIINKNADGSIQIGSNDIDIDLTSEGLKIDGEPLITKKANGILNVVGNGLEHSCILGNTAAATVTQRTK